MKNPIILSAIIALLAAMPAYSQYSSKSFHIKQTSDLYDERGFGQNKAASLDGKLVVSASNGNVSYTYPISSSTASGYPLDVSLNYCGSVAFTTYQSYWNGATATNWDGEGFSGGNSTEQYWSRFSDNRPAWLLGVNGFAIQALSVTTDFFNGRDMKNETRSWYGDADFVWTIDGYDVCNRMKTLRLTNQSSGGSNTPIPCDVIKLLRSDGSLLELHGKHIDPHDSNAIDTARYVGYYVPYEANNAGFAIVQYDDVNNNPKFMRGFFSNCELRARILHYFPGDGLEYVFREWTLPYGINALDSTDDFGGLKGHPTVFYLEEIRSDEGTLMNFQRTRHSAGLEGDYNTRGRALIKEFGDHSIEYGDGWLSIQALGRTTKVWFDSVSVYGSTETGVRLPLSTLGELNETTKSLSDLARADGIYKSYTGQVTKIVDPEGRVTRFTYQKRRRVYEHHGFPFRSTSYAVDSMVTSHYRLKEVTEPSTRYVIHYFQSVDSTFTTQNELATGYVDGNATVPEPASANDIADTVKKYDPCGQLLTTDIYSQAMTFHSGDEDLRTCKHIQVDNIAGLRDTTTYQYQSFYLPRLSIIPNTLKPRYTGLRSVTHSAAGVVTKDQTFYYTNDRSHQDTVYSSFNCDDAAWAPFFVLPAAEFSFVNGYLKAHNRYCYHFDAPLCDFGGDTLFQHNFGYAVAESNQFILNPCPHLEEGSWVYPPWLTRKTFYKNLPLKDTMVVSVENWYNKFDAIRRYDSLVANGAIDPNIETWEEARFDPRVNVPASYIGTGTSVHYSPLRVGLVTRQEVWQRNGWFGTDTLLSGGGHVYATSWHLTDTTISGTHVTLVDSVRGVPVADSIIGRNNTAYLTNKYGWAYQYNRQHYLPYSGVNANDAKGLTLYNHHLPALRQSDGTYNQPTSLKVDDRDHLSGVTLQNKDQFCYTYVQPGAERLLVRKYQPGGSLLTDTLTTLYERSYYGVATATVDPNNAYSRFDYDLNARLKTAWTPLDFPSDSDAANFTGTRSVTLPGRTLDTTLHSRIFCGVDGITGRDSAEADNTLYSLIRASRLSYPRPKCRCGPDSNRAAKRGGNHIQLSCVDTLNYTASTVQTGVLDVVISPSNPLKAAVSVDSVRLRLLITSVTGSCVHLDVRIPQFGFSETYIFNCSGGYSTLSTRQADSANPQTLGAPPPTSSGCNTALTHGQTQGVYNFDVDLTSVKDSLTALANGQIVEIHLSTPTAGGIINFADDASDSRPQLLVKGTFNTIPDNFDYTLAYIYNDDSLNTTEYSKIDDARHTFTQFSASALGSIARRSKSRHYFGADYRLNRSEVHVGSPISSSHRVDTIFNSYSGLGQKTRVKDPDNDTVALRYDALGRPVETINPDGTHNTVAYYIGKPDTTFGITDQNFCCYAEAKVTTDENGRKSVVYTDAFNRVRREVSDSGGAGHLNLMTRYYYDSLGRLTLVLNPKGDSTVYVYDDFGRTRYKYQPDIGSVSYAYDKVGNLRYSQTQEQANKRRVTFNQYDDLNRVLIIGEASFDTMLENLDSLEDHGGEGGGESGMGTRRIGDSAGGLTGATTGKTGARIASAPPPPPSTGTRLTDSLNGQYLHDLGTSGILTSNKTEWSTPLIPVPTFNAGLTSVTCPPPPLTAFATDIPVGPFLVHPASKYNPVRLPVANKNDFEHLAKYPHFTRIAIWYDTLPPRIGPVWGNLPAYSKWDSIAPKGSIRNMRCKDVAVAYREHGGEPYHYTVLSYDERGRAEALLRYTENLGFDAVYYTYNSANQVSCVRVVDPLRQYTTWYGYDFNGRVDSVWTSLGSVGSGLGVATLAHPAMPTRPQNPDIVYSYTKTGNLNKIRFVPANTAVNVLVQFAYNHRKGIDSLVAWQGDSPLFRQVLGYDSVGQIITQISQHASQLERRQKYYYDNADRLRGWNDSLGTQGMPPVLTDSATYTYDAIGNRQNLVRPGSPNKTYTYSGAAGGSNRLAAVSNTFIADLYTYNANGSTSKRDKYVLGAGTPTLISTESFFNSYRELLWKYTKGNTVDWRYRYSSGDEREQKRAYGLPSLLTIRIIG